MSKITNFITLNEYADKHELDIKRLRRFARKNEFPGDVKPFKFGTVWAIDASAPVIVLPEKSARGARRADGRQRMIVYVNNTELTAINALGVETVDPRVVSKQRRDARKLADTVANDPFAQSKLDALENELLANARENDDNAERVAIQMMNDARNADDDNG